MNRAEQRAAWITRHRGKGSSSASQSAPQSNKSNLVSWSMRPADSGNATLANSSLDVHIEEIVLHGFPAGHRHSIGDATHHELTRLLGSNGLSPNLSQSSERIDAGNFQMNHGAEPDVVGSLVANAVYGGLKR